MIGYVLCVQRSDTISPATSSSKWLFIMLVYECISSNFRNWTKIQLAEWNGQFISDKENELESRSTKYYMTFKVGKVNERDNKI